MNATERDLRNRLGQLQHAYERKEQARKEMHADLIGQRQDITDAIAMLERGEVRDAIEVLQSGLDRRNRTRPQRKVA